jgi:hypothetical protein
MQNDVMLFQYTNVKGRSRQQQRFTGKLGTHFFILHEKGLSAAESVYSAEMARPAAGSKP